MSVPEDSGPTGRPSERSAVGWLLHGLGRASALAECADAPALALELDQLTVWLIRLDQAADGIGEGPGRCSSRCRWTPLERGIGRKIRDALIELERRADVPFGSELAQALELARGRALVLGLAVEVHRVALAGSVRSAEAGEGVRSVDEDGGFVQLMAECLTCGRVFTCNPARVPSYKGEPVCEGCMVLVNAERRRMGLPEFVVLPGAYDPAPVGEVLGG